MEAYIKASQSEKVTVEKDGRSVTASQDFAPGQEILREFPLLFIGKDQENMSNAVEAERKTGIHRRVWAVYFQYMVLGEETKAQIRELHSQTDGSKADSFRDLLSRSDMASSVNVEDFLAITMVFNFNAIEERVDGSKNLRDGTGCVWYSAGDGWCTVRAIVPIKQGAALTFNCYDNDFVCQPAHLRRAYLSRSKEIVCHCPRCENEADDTRQFSCASKSCGGRHFVSQPFITDPLLLLPCTDCGKSLSAEAQKLLLYREKTLATTVKAVMQEVQQFPAKPAPGQQSLTQAEILALEFLSPTHYLTQYLAKCKQVVHESGGDKPQAAAMGTLALSALDAIVTFPAPVTADCCLALGESHEDMDSPQALLTALCCYQRALRISCVLFGAEERRNRFQDPVSRVLARLQATGVDAAAGKTKECHFCGQAKDASHSLRRCGGCKAANYCSPQCQRAHWPLHQPCCKK